jgi:hypothetical protein
MPRVHPETQSLAADQDIENGTLIVHTDATAMPLAVALHVAPQAVVVGRRQNSFDGDSAAESLPKTNGASATAVCPVHSADPSAVTVV